MSLKTTFALRRTIEPFYTGGPVSLSASGRVLLSATEEDAVISDLRTGRVLATISGDGEPLTGLALTPSASHAITVSRSLAMRIYSLPEIEEALEGEPLEPSLDRTVKAHTAPVVAVAVDSTGTLVSTGAADGQVKVWDIRGGYVTHSLHSHSGLVTALCFFSVPESEVQTVAKKGTKAATKEAQKAVGTLRLASGGEDGRVRVWNLATSAAVATLTSHVSVIRAIDYNPATNFLLSGSRDRTVVVWSAKTWKAVATIPTLEPIEAAGFAADGFFFAAGLRGRVRVWSILRRREITADAAEDDISEEDIEETSSIVYATKNDELGAVFAVRADQVLAEYSLEPVSGLAPDGGGADIGPLPVRRQISGTHDEVIDMALVANGTHLALATNTADIRVVSVTEERKDAGSADPRADSFGADAAHLSGHTDVILALDVDRTGKWLATASKDNTARLWRIEPEKGVFRCHSIYTGHAGAVSGIAISKSSEDPQWLVTGSQDKTVKMWSIPEEVEGETSVLAGRARYTRQAHDREINAVDSSRHSQPLFATASQDRTVRIWSASTGEAIGVLKGHTRGVWAVRFDDGTGSKSLAVTGAGDKTVRIWSLADYSCLATLEGHSNSVLKVTWFVGKIPSERDSADDEDTDGEETGGGMQDVTAKTRPLLASAAADGLVKVWDPTTHECVSTLDGHEDRVWALVATKGADENTNSGLISAGADALINFWADTTVASASATRAAAAREIEQDQALQNLRRAGRLREAVAMAIALGRPGTLLSLFTELLEAEDKAERVKVEPEEAAPAGADDRMEDVVAAVAVLGAREKFRPRPVQSLVEIVADLTDGQLYTLLVWLRDWNATARHADVAQRLLQAVLVTVPAGRFLTLDRARNDGANQEGDVGVENKKTGRKANVADILRALSAYSDRHRRRVDELAEEAYVLEYLLGQMR